MSTSSKVAASLGRFLARDRQEAIRTGRPLPDCAEGALLFADISGFTALTESLGQKLGPRDGAEAITKILDEVYEALIDEISRRRGSVILFSGDALTCWFEGDKGTRAIASALGCQEAMLAFAAQTSHAAIPVSLAIKVSVVRGPVHRVVVGDPEHQLLDVIGGKTVERLAIAAELTAAGEVLVDMHSLSSMPDGIEVLERREGPGSPEAFAVISGFEGRPSLLAPSAEEDDPGLDVEQAKPWLLKPVFERICAGHGDYLSELRIATALFLEFRGIELDRDPEAPRQLSEFIAWVQRTVGHLGGYVLSLSLDKGSYVLCTFGAPIGHDDDAFRAAKAARALLEAPAKCEAVESIRIGIARGRIHGGICGSQRRSAYNVYGSDVNLAARLMSRASPGQVLISSRVAAEVEGKFETRALGTYEFKGFDTALSILELGQRVQRLSALASRMERALPEMVGRHRERELFRRALSALLQGGRPTTHILEGEAGIGKSLCINSLLHEADQMGVPSVCAVGDAIDSGTLYHAYRPVFEQLFGLQDLPDDEERRRAHVLELLGDDEETRRLTPLLSNVLPFDFPETEQTRNMTGQVRADNTKRLLCSLFQRLAAARALILVIEDAHWLDSASWALTREIVQRLPGVMVLVATRPIQEPWPLAYRELREQEGVQVLQLDGLSGDETLHLVKLRLGVDSLPAPVSQLILAKAEGHPFFSEEIAYALRDSHQIRVDGRECRLAAGLATAGDLSVPDTVEGTITSRMDALSSSQRLLLKVGSVIGRVFPMQVLRDIYPVGAESGKIPADLDTLVRLDMTPVETPPPNTSYIFKHVITQQVAYGLMVTQQRKMLHRAVAEWFERRSGGDLERHYTILAHHWERAEVPEKALVYLEAASKQALHNFANREAIDLARRALALSEDIPDGRAGVTPERRALWHRYLADAHLGLGHNPQSRRQFERALGLQGNAMPSGVLRFVASFLWQVLLQALLRLSSGALLRAAAAARAGLLERANTWERYAQVVYFQNERATTIYASLRAANCAESAGPSPELSRAYANLCITLGMARLPWLSLLYDRLAHRVAEQVGDVQALGWAQELSGAASVGFAQLDKARAETDLAMENFHRIGDWRHWEEAVWVQFATTLAQADLPRAMHLAQSLESSANRRRDAQSQIIGLCGQAEVLLQSGLEGGPEGALGRMERAASLVDDNVTVIERIRVYSDLALARCRTGDRKGCVESLDAWLRLCRESQPVASYVMEAYGSAAMASLELLSQDGADEGLARSAVRWLGFYAFVFELARPRYQIARAALLRREGRSKQAARLLHKARVSAQVRGQLYDAMLAHRELAATLGPDDPARAEHLSEASTLAARLRGALDGRLLLPGERAAQSRRNPDSLPDQTSSSTIPMATRMMQ